MKKLKPASRKVPAAAPLSCSLRPTVAGYGYGLTAGSYLLDKIIPEKQPEKLTELLKDVSPVTDAAKEDALKKEEALLLLFLLLLRLPFYFALI